MGQQVRFVDTLRPIMAFLPKVKSPNYQVHIRLTTKGSYEGQSDLDWSDSLHLLDLLLSANLWYQQDRRRRSLLLGESDSGFQ